MVNRCFKNGFTETVVKNCGENVHFQIAARNTIPELIKIVKKKETGAWNLKVDYDGTDMVFMDERAGLIEEMVNDVVDSALDSDDIEDEIDEEVHKVLTAIAGETATQLPKAVTKEWLKQPAQSTEDAELVVKSQILAGGWGVGKFTSGLQGGVHIVSWCTDFRNT